MNTVPIPMVDDEPAAPVVTIAKPATTVDAVAIPTLTEKAMLAGLSISCWSARKNVKQVAQEAADAHRADVSQLQASKSVIASTALEAIKANHTAARDYHRSRTLPWLDDGARILTASLFWEYSKKMQEFRQTDEALVAEFLANYPTYCAATPALLGSLYDPADYPTPDRIAGKFGFRTNIGPLPSSADFRVGLGAAEEERIRAEIDGRLQSGVNEAMRDLWDQVHNTVAHMAQKLREFSQTEEVDAATGKTKTKTIGIFRDSLVENVRELAGLLRPMNLTGDSRLDAIAARLETELCDVDADDLRKNDALREKVAMSAEDVLAQMAGYLGD